MQPETRYLVHIIPSILFYSICLFHGLSCFSTVSLRSPPLTHMNCVSLYNEYDNNDFSSQMDINPINIGLYALDALVALYSL